MRSVERDGENVGGPVASWDYFHRQEGPRRNGTDRGGAKLDFGKGQEHAVSPAACSTLEEVLTSMSHDEGVHVGLLALEVEEEVIAVAVLEDEGPGALCISGVVELFMTVRHGGMFVQGHHEELGRETVSKCLVGNLGVVNLASMTRPRGYYNCS